MEAHWSQQRLHGSNVHPPWMNATYHFGSDWKTAILTFFRPVVLRRATFLNLKSVEHATHD